MSDQMITSIRVDRDLWREARIHAMRKGLTMKELIEHLLKEELKGERKSKGGS